MKWYWKNMLNKARMNNDAQTRRNCVQRLWNYRHILNNPTETQTEFIVWLNS